MFTTPLHIYNALQHLRDAYLKLNDDHFNYHAMDKHSQRDYHELVALCQGIAEKHAPTQGAENE